MAIVAMSKLFLAAMKEEKEEILKSLQKAGVVQILPLEQEDLSMETAVVSVHEMDAKISRTQEVLDILSSFGEEKKASLSRSSEVHEEGLADRERELEADMERIFRLKDEKERLEEKKQTALEQVQALLPFQRFPLPLEERETARVAFLLGSIPRTVSEETLRGRTKELAAEIFILEQEEETLSLCAVCRGKEKQALADVLAEYEFSPLDSCGLVGTVKKNIRRLRDEAQNLSMEAKKLSKALKKEADSQGELWELLAVYQNKRERLLAREKLGETGSVFFLSGWIPSDKEKELTKIFGKKFPMAHLGFSPPKEEDETPILLENSGFVRPFELVTELYSMPSPFEIDPNPVMSIFYVVFFGMMLSDAGYGAVLSLATGIFLMKKKPTGTMEKLLKLIFFGGISAIFWGVLFGGWFGDLLSSVPLFRPRWFNPLEDPMTLLLWSFVFGGVHIVTGMGVRAFLLIREGKWLDAVFDIGFWYVVFAGLLLWFFAGTPWIFAAGLLGLVLTQGRQEKNILKKFSKGLLSLYDITGFLSDILSYSRLLALGLATGVIGQVVNTMASLGGSGIFGKILFVLVLVVGHSFNIAINTLGAYVHASRLQYVEFYGKFYSGGGKPFTPFRLRGVH